MFCGPAINELGFDINRSASKLTACAGPRRCDFSAAKKGSIGYCTPLIVLQYNGTAEMGIYGPQWGNSEDWDSKI